MELEISSSKFSASRGVGEGGEMDQLRVKRKTLEDMMEQCYRALELLRSSGDLDVDDDDGDAEGDVQEGMETSAGTSPAQREDSETAKLHDLLKSRLESPMFLERLESIHISVPQSNSDEGSSWDVVSECDLWEGGNVGEDIESDQESYVLITQDDIVEGIACFTAAYLLSLNQAQDLTPNQLQEALSKTFSVKKKKGKLQKAWEGSKLIYNVASWGATAIGIYQNPTLFRAASVAFWTSCRVVSKLF